MKSKINIFICLALVIAFAACERPKSPDFKLNHEVEAPLSIAKTYTFLGGTDALIDTTKKDFEDVFDSGDDGLIRITKEEEFNFGDLNDAIPEVEVPSTTVNSEVGEIALNNFSSSGNVGSASFEDITGSPAPLQTGDPLPAGSTTNDINIEFTTDYFESAVIKNDGSLELTISNNLGFDIDKLSITLISGSQRVGSTTLDNFSHDETQTGTIDIPASTQLHDLNVDISASWSSQEMEDAADNLIVDDVSGQNLVASQVTAAIESQDFTNSGSSTVDEGSFKFRESNHFVELSSGELSINIDNSINLGIDNLDIEFPDIRDKSTDNPLVLNLSDIPSREEGGNFSDSFDLSDYRIYAENGTIDYEISAKAEDTQQGSGSDTDTRTIEETNELTAEVNLNNLQIIRAEGYISPRQILLNTDATADGIDNVDAFNDDEAEITNIDGISDISDRISNLTFENPSLRTLYETNLGVNTTVYAVIVGTDSKGNTTYLTGKSGSEFEVEEDDIPSSLQVKNKLATADQVIKFDIDTAEVPNPEQGESGENIFNAENTTTSKFFSNLPTNIRFVGVAEINKEKRSGTIVNPVIFDPRLNLDLPLNFSADGATFNDTLEADLGDLPGEGDKQTLSEATLTLNYTNRLPLDLDLLITMLDEDGEEVTHKSDVNVGGADIDSNGFVNQPNQNKMDISFSEEELKDLHRTQNLKLDITINTPQQQAVRIKGDDSITLQIQLKAGVNSTVN